MALERGGNPKRGRLIGLSVGTALLLSACAGTAITKTGHETAGLYNIVLVMATLVFVAAWGFTNEHHACRRRTLPWHSLGPCSMQRTLHTAANLCGQCFQSLDFL